MADTITADGQIGQMSRLSVVISHHNAHPSRLRNLMFIISYYKNLYRDAEIVVSEVNSRTDGLQGVLHIVSELSDCLHSTGFAFNEGFKRSGGKVVIFADSDCIGAENNMRQMIKMMGRYQCILPYTGAAFNMTQQETIDFIESGISAEGKRRGDARHINYGGIRCFTRAGYIKIGGHDPAFKNWGSEDDTLILKARRLLRFHRIDGKLLHLWHAGSPNKAESQVVNRSLYNKIRDMKNEELLAYVASLGTGHLI